MRALIRADASVTSGAGHISRCLALAEILRSRGAEVIFCCRELEGNMILFIEGKEFQVMKLPVFPDAAEEISLIREKGRFDGKVDWTVLDSYLLGIRWEKLSKKFSKKLMVIDDLGRDHDCEILMDQNLSAERKSYAGALPGDSLSLLGPRYALLGKQFWALDNKNSRSRTGQIKRILVLYGGSDSTDETSKAIRAIRKLEYLDVSVDVAVGLSNKNRRKIEKALEGFDNFCFHYGSENIAELMMSADISLGAGGVSAWERCVTGLPAIVTIVSENQKESTYALEKSGAIINLGWYESVTENQISCALEETFDSPTRVAGMSEKSIKITDGRGALRVADILLHGWLR